ncbi:hypothetical protein CCR97_23560 [Rhodoplanes elegans]|uniref:AB hydrolase-1 domain-containing protein n=1 Tax=Rhodoplanes elegans TaxID=29408 RepID=A0A327KIQ1_9BRAD|nr:alpha/beta fold hydrolase [Rhodoplanes elegans]MBK5961159.1 hypothetical protein [Rhodoplanes elegans]RAI38026.1 hypothetical protein CH338_14120 [Rhodoplanes elegans]
MRTELITIPTPTLPLDGAFHWPDDRPIRGAVLLFHGNTMNFYTGAPRFLPRALTRLGLACLAFNRRGHDILSIRDSRAAEGAAFQLTHEAIEDNALAARWLAARGHDAPIVIGHSNGGMLAVPHVVAHPQTPCLVLLSAHAGGRQNENVSRIGLFAGERFAEIKAQAEALVAAGRGRELIVLPHWWYVTSAEAFIDRTTQLPNTLELAPRITCPVLYVRGDQEPAAHYPAEAFQARAGGPCDVEIVPDCDHFYKGREDAVAAIVAGWLSQRLGLAAD